MDLKSEEYQDHLEDMEYTSIMNHFHAKECSVKDGVYLNAKIGCFPHFIGKKGTKFNINIIE